MTVHERPFGRHLEDFVVGDVYRHWPGKTITEYDDHLFCMITMNHHPLHTNDWYAGQSVQGRNVVVGNLVYSLVLGMSVPDVSGAAIANLEVETLQHKFPTFHGDTIHAETRVLDVKESTSKPDRGVVTVETKGFNQDGQEVCYFRRRLLAWKRDAAPPRQRPYDVDTAGTDPTHPRVCCIRGPAAGKPLDKPSDARNPRMGSTGGSGRQWGGAEGAVEAVAPDDDAAVAGRGRCRPGSRSSGCRGCPAGRRGRRSRRRTPPPGRRPGWSTGTRRRRDPGRWRGPRCGRSAGRRRPAAAPASPTSPWSSETNIGARCRRHGRRLARSSSVARSSTVSSSAAASDAGWPLVDAVRRRRASRGGRRGRRDLDRCGADRRRLVDGRVDEQLPRLEAAPVRWRPTTSSGAPIATTHRQRRRRWCSSGRAQITWLRPSSVASSRSAGGQDSKATSPAGRLFDPDPAAVGFHEAVGDREAETGATGGAVAARVGSGEAFEGVGGEVGREARPVVEDAHARAVRRRRRRRCAPSIRRGVVDGVVEEVADDPPDRGRRCRRPVPGRWRRRG